MSETAVRRDIVTLQPASNAMTPMDMLNQAVERGANIEVLTKLMDLQERWETNQARKAFDAAIAEAKAEIAPVVRNATGHNNKKYADFAAIARAVDPIITKHGLSYRFRSEQTERISVTCILSHKAGHSEQTTLSGPPDGSGSKNAIQAIGSTLTYLQRYSLVQALGLAASNDDDGKASGAAETLSEEQIEAMRRKIIDVDADLSRFLAFIKVERIDDILASKFDAAMAILDKKASGK